MTNYVFFYLLLNSLNNDMQNSTILNYCHMFYSKLDYIMLRITFAHLKLAIELPICISLNNESGKESTFGSDSYYFKSVPIVALFNFLCFANKIVLV